MADPTSQVIKPILDIIIKDITSLIKEEYSLVHGVKEDIENLERLLTSIRAVIEDAENKQVNDPRLKAWLGELKEAASDAEDILDTFATKAYLWKQKQKKRTFLIAKQKEDFHLDIKVNGGETVSPNYTGYFVDKSDVVGREDDKERITHLLLSNEYDKEGDVSVIPIIGMGGLGKTTLAQLVFNDNRVSGHFESRMPKVLHILDLEIDFPKVSSTSSLPKKKPSEPAWYRLLPKLGGIEIIDAQPIKKQPTSSLLKQSDKEVNRSDTDVDKAVDQDLNEPKAEQEETRSNKSFPSTQSKSSSTKDSSNEINKQASGLPQLVDEEEEKETDLVPRSASKKAPEEKNITNPTSETIDNEDDDMEYFYTSLGAKSETSPSTSSSVITDVQPQKTRPGQSDIDKALDIVRNVLATDFSSACHPGRSISLDSELQLLCDLDENDGISVGMKFLVLQLSKDFKVLKSRCCQANDTIESCTNLIKPMAEIAFQLDANKQKFLELNSVEATIQMSINEAEAQINELQKKVNTFPLGEQHMHDKQTMSTDGKSISGAEGQINELKQKIDSLTKQKGKGKQEKKMIYTDGKKLKEKMDVAAKAEEEKKEAERIKREIEEKWSDYKKQFEMLTCSGEPNFVLDIKQISLHSKEDSNMHSTDSQCPCLASNLDSTASCNLHGSLKKWGDKLTGYKCFMLYARSLYITWVNREYWTWDCFGEIGLQLSLPNGRVQERQVCLLEKPRKQWFELNVGNFQSKDGESGEVCFDLFGHGGHWKNGLIIKGGILRPKQR
ncbi:hypothetical protein SO802_009834 [Lithocarpus litseifolius]|uniref:Rx N-terminal domain-containing protein n=1 Tax=Lithocarpus litseifolius TaxID=425828 RepID=A0AAW2DCK7_9ROSI